MTHKMSDMFVALHTILYMYWNLMPLIRRHSCSQEQNVILQHLKAHFSSQVVSICCAVQQLGNWNDHSDSDHVQNVRQHASSGGKSWWLLDFFRYLGKDQNFYKYGKSERLLF